MKLDPLAVPIEAASEFAPFSNNWNRRKSAFSVARKKSRAPTPGKENKAASVTGTRQILSLARLHQAPPLTVAAHCQKAPHSRSL